MYEISATCLVNCIYSSYNVVTSLFTCTVDTVSSFSSYFYNLIIFYSLLLANYTYFLISIHHSESETQNEMCFKPYLYRIVIIIKMSIKLSHLTS